MQSEEVLSLLDRLGLRHPCDLDLLLFFVRHPRSLLTNQQIATFLGYEIKHIAESLDVLLTAGFLTRVQTETHAAQLYVLAPGEPDGDGLSSLVPLASTREGRLAMLRLLRRRTRSKPDGRAEPDSMNQVG